jgi:hypothetical protein
MAESSPPLRLADPLRDDLRRYAAEQNMSEDDALAHLVKAGLAQVTQPPAPSGQAPHRGPDPAARRADPASRSDAD